MAWKGEAEGFCYGISHQGICPLLKQWRQVGKGKATVEKAGLRGAMVEYLRAAVSAEPEGSRESLHTASAHTCTSVC